MKVTAIVPAAGEGKRMGGIVSKPYLLLGGRPILSFSLDALSRSDDVREIIVVARQEEINLCKEIVDKYNFTKVSHVLPGGEQRQDSVYHGLKGIKGDVDIVLIHDGVRPFLSQLLLKEIINCASRFKAAVTAIPVKDTLKKVNTQGVVEETVSRDNVWCIQTPQAFEYSFIMKAYEDAYKNNFYGTDDAGLIERGGYPVKIVGGSPQNIKITMPEDLTMAEAILELNRW
jgi:2-C-methyl-D-erythritol 4-phosphate cytidylyltransferase